jgi:hypothetical protein
VISDRSLLGFLEHTHDDESLTDRELSQQSQRYGIPFGSLSSLTSAYGTKRTLMRTLIMSALEE